MDERGLPVSVASRVHTTLNREALSRESVFGRVIAVQTSGEATRRQTLQTVTVLVHSLTTNTRFPKCIPHN